ncbi:TetR family transcriptional regulator [Serratia ureilytica]|uniref:TetR/AcrR family transcriptional regulator n=1 Tax=Serratia ureilytica TaxID=300181 RepID=UPI002DB91CB7|nr:TetR/AcrR family transcriptional regulator [Serratia ureilytica]MEB5995234.1 TetR family transcriptional regulator [Serratia ureilytica]
MARKARTEMIEETRQKLVAAARLQFGNVGYAETVMDDLTAQAGLTRGALYHHFGDKKGLFLAVVQAIDAEMDAHLVEITASTADDWEAFAARCRGYLIMMTEPQAQRILLRDSPSVLGADYLRASKLACISWMTGALEVLMAQRRIAVAEPEALAHLINGGLMDAALWVAHHPEKDVGLEQALASLNLLLNGLRSTAV